MSKTACLLAAALAVATPVALAETAETISVTITYDAALLGNDAGAMKVMEIIEDEAREACRAPATTYHRGTVDKNCVAEVIAKAAVLIEAQMAEIGEPMPRRLAELVTLRTEQR